jgi:hypothetical protein
MAPGLAFTKAITSSSAPFAAGGTSAEFLEETAVI